MMVKSAFFFRPTSLVGFLSDLEFPMAAMFFTQSKWNE
jgi:hypothetical protein